MTEEEAQESAIDELIERNEWRGGLSAAEQACFEAGWDAALKWCDENLLGDKE
jgi:hypothetical protein